MRHHSSEGETRTGPQRGSSVAIDIQTVGALTAAVASLVGGAVALNQFTLPTRLRRLEQWAREASDGLPSGPRTETLAAIRLWAAARLVGGTYVPARYFAEAALWIGLGPALAALFVTSGESRWLLLTFPFAVAVPARRGIRVFLERQRIVRQFLAGEDLDPPRLKMIDQMEGGYRREFGFAILIAAGVCLIGGAAGWLMEGESDGWFLVPGIAGLGLLSIAQTWLVGQTVRPPSRLS